MRSSCGSDFVGTSASTPLVSGVIALVLEAKLVIWLVAVVLHSDHNYTVPLYNNDFDIWKETISTLALFPSHSPV